MKPNQQSIQIVIETVHGLKQSVFFEPLSLSQQSAEPDQQLTSVAGQAAKGQPRPVNRLPAERVETNTP